MAWCPIQPLPAHSSGKAWHRRGVEARITIRVRREPDLPDFNKTFARGVGPPLIVRCLLHQLSVCPETRPLNGRIGGEGEAPAEPLSRTRSRRVRLAPRDRGERPPPESESAQWRPNRHAAARREPRPPGKTRPQDMERHSVRSPETNGNVGPGSSWPSGGSLTDRTRTRQSPPHACPASRCKHGTRPRCAPPASPDSWPIHRNRSRHQRSHAGWTFRFRALASVWNLDNGGPLSAAYSIFLRRSIRYLAQKHSQDSWTLSLPDEVFERIDQDQAIRPTMPNGSIRASSKLPSVKAAISWPT